MPLLQGPSPYLLMGKYLLLLAVFAAALSTFQCKNTPKPAEAATPSGPDTTATKTARPDPNDLLGALQGKWEKDGDPSSVIEFADTQMRYFSDNKFTHQSMIEIDGNCESPVCKPGDTDISEGWCFTEMSIDGAGKYVAVSNFVSRCEGELLQFIPLTGAKSPVSYKKIH